SKATRATLAMDHHLLAGEALAAGNVAEAIRLYEAAVRLEPADYWSLLGLGQCLSLAGHTDRELAGAAAVLTACIGKRPDHAYAWYRRGEAYSRLRRYADSIADFDKAINMAPTFAWAWNARGLSFLEIGQSETALPSFARALELDPEPTHWNN